MWQEIKAIERFKKIVLLKIHMYEKVNITENHLNVISLFTEGFGREYYIREVQKILKISPRTAQIILEDLEKKAVLESQIRGKIKTYKIKRNFIAKKYLVLSEFHKEISFLEKNPLIKEIVSKIIPNIHGIGVIFGSYVKGTQKKDSDIDIFIIGKYDENEIKKISRLYKIELNIKNYPLNIFKKNIGADFLIKEVLKKHVIFLNTEDFIEIVVKESD